MTAKRPTHADLARALDLSRGRITQMIAAGMPVFSVEAAQAWRAQNVAPRAGSTRKAQQVPATDPTGGGGATADYATSRSRREAAEASIAALKLAEMRGEVVEKRAVDKAAFEAARHLRDGLMNCAGRLGATVATLTTPDECTAAIAREHRSLLQSWSRTMGVAGEKVAPP